VSAELCLFIFTQCASNFPKEPFSVSVLQECGVAPFSEAAKALESLLCQNPRHFLSNQAIAALGGKFFYYPLVWPFLFPLFRFIKISF
jgi:hypothetical protein